MPTKWNLLLRAKNIYVSWVYVTKIYYISAFMGLFLPPTVGSDVVRGYYITKKKHQLPDIISSIVVERIIGLIALLFFALVGVILFIEHFTTDTLDLTELITVSIISLLFTVCGTIFLLSDWFKEKVISSAEKFSKKKVFGKFTSLISSVQQSLADYKSYKVTLLIFFWLTVLEIALKAYRSYVIALVLNINLPVLYYFAFIPIILMLTRLPISLNGFGIHESGFVYFLSLMGVSKTLGLSVGIIDHFILIYAVLPGGLFYMFEKDRVNKDHNVDLGLDKEQK
jgi:uncharacterized protein (TIRG00374 family)